MSEPKKYWTQDPDMVDRYLRGEFSPEERRRLDAEIADCEPCRRMLHTEMELAAGIRRQGRDEMKAKLRKRIGADRNASFASYQWVGLAAAIVIIAVGVGLYQVWFSDLQRPTQFRQEIVLTPDPDSAGRADPAVGDNEIAGESSGSSAPLMAERRRRERIAEPPPEEIVTEELDSATPQHNAAGGATPSVAAQSDVAESKDAAGADESSAIWLIGNVVMIPHSREATEARRLRSMESPTGATPESAVLEKSESERSRGASKRTKENSGIVLRREPTSALPAGRSQSRPLRTDEMEIQLSRSAEGLALTLYTDRITEDELREISLASPTDDTLIVTLPNQRISLHLPAGWNLPAARRR